ncbi:MAG: DUF1610 domain-containing protein [Methanomicrobiales archaeon]|nr:DUF1610 domain-containing protein [Methanomicrobiales archaeon]
MTFKKCTSCNAPLADEGWTGFPCPECGEMIYRCHRCREQSLSYECRKCGFRGP